MIISLDIFCNQWVKKQGLERQMASRFDKNVFDFTTAAGETSTAFFKQSFSYGGFNGSGQKWAPRKDNRWSRKFTHDVMLDTKTLRDSIKGGVTDRTRNGRKHDGKRIFVRGARYDISTNEFSQRITGKRGKNKTGRYARFHNDDPRFSNFTVRKNSTVKPIRRQFIGLSKTLDAEIAKLIPMIFKGFPNA